MKSIGLKRRTLLKVAPAVPALLAGWNSQSAAAEVDSPGSAAFEVLDFEWVDIERQRLVPARMYLPIRTHLNNPMPLVLFSHGIGGSRFGYAHIGRHLASCGFASLHVQHTGSDRSLWLAGAPWGIVERLHHAAREREAMERVYDLRFVLQRIFDQELGVLLDREYIAAAGHSYGANTVLLAAGARVVRNGEPLELADTSIRAVIVISTPAFYGEPSLESILAPIKIPSLHISSTADVIRIPGYVSGPEDRVAAFNAIGSEKKVLTMFTGGSHRVFTDRRGIGDWTLDNQVKIATRELTSAFLAHIFQHQIESLQLWRGRYSNLISEFRYSCSSGCKEEVA